MSRLENFTHMSYLSGVIKTDLDRMKLAIDLRDDLWEVGGYNIERADQGMFEEVEKRNRTFSCIRDYVTTTATTPDGPRGPRKSPTSMAGTSPLMPKDGRNPPSQPDHPAWDPSPIRMMNDQQQREADAQRAATATTDWTSQFCRRWTRWFQLCSWSAPPTKAPPSKPRPSTPPARKDW